MRRLQRFAWFVLAYTVAVILWGAYVRATGSGAGCGSHWPLCNGEVVPRSASIETLVEYSHRVTSGVALLLVAALLVWVRRACPPGHPARTGAVLSVIFMVTEAAVGAGLVLFELVADNASMARALFMAAHLLNTFILLACIALTAWWLSGGGELLVRQNARTAAAAVAACAALLLAGTSGAVAALGDTLFPSSTLAEALRADLSPASHVLIRLRMLHPVFAVGAAILVVALTPRLARAAGGSPPVMRAARAVNWTVGLQLALGFLNVVLLAPVWLQMVHLLVADIIWVGFVLVAATAVASRESSVVGHSRQLSRQSPSPVGSPVGSPIESPVESSVADRTLHPALLKHPEQR